ncbi:peptidase S24 [Pseudomonas sp. PA15(2017)]|uniref:LexA family protein n=1 Tax=Pseudomonas sp. PA15(2017) TaxID=1932111 RepID=UPI000959744E|nr:translesion error-prone DNA polymerase V autoproteolytic subunit [Pseudomonas sp. PA15(2017)]OLU22921.1 peptidase S24 [Pseudomonas sp. PA15(2017)]
MGNATILGPVGSSASELPFFSYRVPAGFPSPAQDHLEQKISLDEVLGINAPQTYLVRVGGDSMIGVGIFDGDVVVVDKSLDVVSGDVVIGAVNSDPVLKTYIRQGLQVILQSENSKYPPRYILEGDEFEVWGVVTAGLRRLRCHV